jgi:16S rRNA (adenine1518-N6/adenine1519-N6)-dimethyltransferase
VTQAIPDLPDLDVHALLKRFKLRPNPRLGQNFLVDKQALLRVVAAAEIDPGEHVLEIGAGLGSLTRFLAELAKQVLAVEVDKHFIPVLREVLSPYANVHIVRGNILELNLEEYFSQAGIQPMGYLVVANIPYYITSALLRHLLGASLRPARLVLTVQREVAERICATPGEMSLLALSVQVYGNPRITTRIPAGSFYPVPNVDSAVVRVNIEENPKIPTRLLDKFFLLAKAGFSQKRKTLRNALAGGMHWSTQQAEQFLHEAGIDAKRRAQTVSMDEWLALAKVISNP